MQIAHPGFFSLHRSILWLCLVLNCKICLFKYTSSFLGNALNLYEIQLLNSLKNLTANMLHEIFKLKCT